MTGVSDMDYNADVLYEGVSYEGGAARRLDATCSSWPSHAVSHVIGK